MFVENQAKKIVEKLQQEGYVAYFAGGYVRDMLLGLKSKDIDIVTSAEPQEIEKLFKNTVPVGKKFGVILVLAGKLKFEVATFREDVSYEDKRRPTAVRFADEKADAMRRDFTINGLFFDPIGKIIIDHVGGKEDIKKKVIRFIGDPEERIEEDHLRLVRAIRLKITLGFQYSQETFNAIRSNSEKIRDVSSERIRDELNYVIISKNRHIGLVELSESGLLANIIPEVELLKGVPQPIEYHHEGDVFTHTYLALKSLPEDAPSYLCWAVLLHDIGKPQTLTHIKKRIVFHNHAEVSAQIAKKILQRLKFTRFAIFDICWLIDNHMKIGIVDKMRPGKRNSFLLDPKFKDLIKLATADSLGTYPQNLDLIKKLKNEVELAVKIRDKAQSAKKKPLIDGDDLIKIGLFPGSEFKIILEDVEDKRIENILKTKDEAIKYVKERYKNA